MDTNFYIDQFSEGEFTYSKPRSAEGEIASSLISYKSYEIHLEMPSKNGIVPKKYIEDAKVALINLSRWLELITKQDRLPYKSQNLNPSTIAR